MREKRTKGGSMPAGLLGRELYTGTEPVLKMPLPVDAARFERTSAAPMPTKGSASPTNKSRGELEGERGTPPSNVD